MSYTEMFIVKLSGAVVPFAEYRNSHRGASMIWHNLFNRYCVDEANEIRHQLYPNNPDKEVYPYSEKHLKALWHIAKREDVPMSCRIVMGATFDWTILEHDHFEDYCKAVEEYAEDFPSGHLLQQIRDIRKLTKRKIHGVCWNQTSVNDMWYGNGNRRFNIYHNNDKAWNLFASLFR